MLRFIHRPLNAPTPLEQAQVWHRIDEEGDVHDEEGDLHHDDQGDFHHDEQGDHHDEEGDFHHDDLNGNWKAAAF